MKATIKVLEIRPGCGCRLRCAEHRRALAQRDAYARAKAENDERFMLERDEARAQLEVATKALDEENIRRVGIAGELDEARRQRDRWYEHVSELVRAEDAVQRNHSRKRPSDELWTAIAQKRAALERARTALRKAGRP